MRLLLSIVLILSLVSIGAFAQKISKQKALEDLACLNHKLQHYHPLYNQEEANPLDLSYLLQSLNKINKDSLDGLSMELKVREMLYELGCSHSSIQANPLAEKPDELFEFPWPIIPTDSCFILLEDDTIKNFQKGAKIYTINGIGVDSFYKLSECYQAADGATPAISNFLQFANTSNLVMKLAGYPDSFLVCCKTKLIPDEDSTVVDTSWFFNDSIWLTKDLYPEPIKFKLKDTIPIYLEEDYKSFSVSKQIGILRLDRFRGEYEDFYEQAFRKMNELQTEHLILDLRSNPGGAVNHAKELLSYLLPEEWSFQYIINNNQPPKPKSLWGRINRWRVRTIMKLSSLFDPKEKTPHGLLVQQVIEPKETRFLNPITILMNGGSGSASTLTISALLQNRDDVQTIGELTGGGYNSLNSMPVPVELPNSGIVVGIPIIHLIQDSDSNREIGILPKQMDQIQVEDLLQKKDRMLYNAIEALIEEK